jgi:hypothetical protein
MTDRRNALGLGLVASAMALSGRSTARAADALSIDAAGVTINKLAVAGPMTIVGDNTLKFGAGVAGKQRDAGKISYGKFDAGSLCILSAGTKDDNRRITFGAKGAQNFSGAWPLLVR